MNNQDKNNGVNKSVINWYPGHMAKAKREIKEKMNLIDIIYDVIDARIPKSSKIKDMEDILKDKPRILVMTKKDLCDMNVTIKWKEKYEKEGYAVVLVDLTTNEGLNELINKTKKLMKPIQEKRIAKGLKEKEVHIGVIGIPNVGKSTLINKLIGKKVAQTGNKPGVTKGINWLKTKSGFLLLDTPGILWPKLDDNEETLNLAVTGTIKTEILDINDIGFYLLTFLKEYYPKKIKERYNITISNNIDDLYEELANKMNFFTKNGEIDYEKISQKLYNDLTSGRLKGVTFDIWK